MRKLQLLILALMTMGIFSPAVAQSVVTIQKGAVVTHPNGQEGKGTVVFMSHSAELVITSSVKDDPVCEEPVRVKDGYEYRMECDISGGSDKRVFTIALKGTTIMEKTGQVQLFKNKTPHFSVDIVSNPITMELAPDGSQFFAEGNGWALIEFNSETPLTVRYSNALQAKLKHGRSTAGTYVDSLIIKVDAIQAVAEAVDTLDARIAALEKHYDEVVKTATDGYLDTLDTRKDSLEEAKMQKEDKLYELTRISIQGEGTNERVVDSETIKSLASKGKLRYNVVLLTKTKTVFKTRYEELLHQAESHKQTRDYAAAKRFYESAAEAEGATDLEKQAALESAQKMGELAEFKGETDRIADKLYEITTSNKRVNKEAFFSLVDEIAQRYDALYKETGEEYYRDEAERLRKQKDNISIVFKGKCVASKYKSSEGSVVESPLPGVKIYASEHSDCGAMDSRAYPFLGDLLGTSDENGMFSFTIKSSTYRSIIFVAPATSKFKHNKHVSLEERSGDRNVKVRFSMNKGYK